MQVAGGGCKRVPATSVRQPAARAKRAGHQQHRAKSKECRGFPTPTSTCFSAEDDKAAATGTEQLRICVPPPRVSGETNSSAGVAADAGEGLSSPFKGSRLWPQRHVCGGKASIYVRGHPPPRIYIERFCIKYSSLQTHNILIWRCKNTVNYGACVYIT